MDFGVRRDSELCGRLDWVLHGVAPTTQSYNDVCAGLSLGLADCKI